MPNSIPASQLVSVIPGVLSAGGNPLSLNAVFITADASIPQGTVQSFPTLQAVQNYFGIATQEAAMAAVYFSGFTGCSKLPGLLYFATYNAAAAAAFVRSGSQAAVSLAQLNAITAGVLTMSVNGTPVVSASINLSGATSFTNAASLINTALGVGAVCTYDTQRAAFVITSPTTGPASTIAFPTGTIATALKFTSPTGAVLSQGAAIATPASVMASVSSLTSNWVTFTTTFEPVLATKQAFATWANSAAQRFLYVAWDSDITALQPNASGSFGALVAGFNGVAPVWDATGLIAAFICGAIGSLDVTQHEGRISLAYKGQTGLIPAVTDATSATNLIANGYNFYGAYATANQQFQFLQPGSMPGPWIWIDPYINQIYLNSQLQLALMSLLSNIKSLPYNTAGYSLIRAACLDPLKQAVNFGSIRQGVALSAAQVAQVNQAAGVNIDAALAQLGWYLQILPATAQVRSGRTSPPMALWYTDGGSVQKLNLASVDVQ